MIIINLTTFTSKQLYPNKTLIFLDEIQECPEARAAIKFLVEQGKFDYIESGSLLGVNYNHVPSYPVGYEEILQMYPMDFEEFCIANGIQEDIFKYLEDCYNKNIPALDAIHKKMLELFKFYVVIGGMPNIINWYYN